MAAAAISFPISLPPPLQPTRRRAPPPSCTHSERGVSFDPGAAFYRSDSAAGRDLAVLAATLNRRGRADPAAPFLCLDAMCGCGVRALRYLAQAGADFVWANDASEALRPVILANLSRFAERELAAEAGRRRWVVSHNDATRLLAERYLRREYFDVIDVDSFGGDSAYVRAALLALKIGGLLYLTSTDWRSARGYGSRSSLSSYGAYVRPMPYPNEVGLRMVIGGAAREAAILGFHIRPLFSYFAYHGPIYRVMVQLCNGKQDGVGNYGFICHCKSCGQSQTFGFDELGQITCGCTDRTGADSITVVGPLWIGPLHDASFLSEMLCLANEWGWAYTSENGVTLEKLLSTMIEESDPRLPPGYIRLDEISHRAKVNSPPLGTLINSLRKNWRDNATAAIAALLPCGPVVSDMQLRLYTNLWHWRGNNGRPGKKSEFDISVDLFNRRRSEETTPMLVGDDDCSGVPDLHGLTSCRFDCLHNHLKRLKLQFDLKELNSFEVCLAKFFAENCRILEILQIDDGDQILNNHINRKAHRWRLSALQKIKHNGNVSSKAMQSI